MNTETVNDSASILERLAELKADNHAEGLGRLAAIKQSMTPQWSESMRAQLDQLDKTASSSRSKLPKLYKLVEEFGDLRSPHVACKAGCSACCRTIPVEISDLEAQHISNATGIAAVALPPGRHTSLDFQDTACSFLVDDQCSIYPYRPFNCRSLASVDRDALSCHEVNTALTIAKDPRAVAVVMSKAQQFEPLYGKIVKRPQMVWADIRQFFPKARVRGGGAADQSADR
jgi:Fe-S-cluster containining protein